jgi:TetR/AcrR family transcriptional repressor of nem operon
MGRNKQFNEDVKVAQAMELFWEQGYYNTSVNDLVKKLKINRASMYDTYGSKIQLFRAALTTYSEKYATWAGEFLYYQLNVREGLFLLFREMLDRSKKGKLNRGCFMANSLTELGQTEAEIREILQADRRAYEKIYVTYLKYGFDKGQLTAYKDILTLASSLYTIQLGICSISKADLSDTQLDDQLRMVLSILN